MAAALVVDDDITGHATAIMVVLDIFPEMMRSMIANLWPPKNVLMLIQNQKGQTFFKDLTTLQQQMILKMDRNGFNLLDISCLYKVIRHFNLLQSPKQGWGQKPKHDHQSEGDDVERMKRYRNDIMHRPRGGLPESERKVFFQVSIGIAQRMDMRNGSPKNGFESQIELMKSYIISRERYKEVLQKCPGYQGQLQEAPDKPCFDLYYGNDIKIKTATNEMIDKKPTRCTLYVKDTNFDVNAVIQKLEDIKDALRKGSFDISLEDAEIGSLILHLKIHDKCFTSTELLHQTIHSFLQQFFQIAAILCISGHTYTVVLVKSDDFISENDSAKKIDLDYLKENSSPVLKLNVDVKNSAFQNELVLYREINRFIFGMYNAIDGQKVPLNGSEREVLMLTSGEKIASCSDTIHDSQISFSKAKQSDKTSSVSSSTVDSFQSYETAKRGEFKKSVRKLKKEEELHLPEEPSTTPSTNIGESPKVVNLSQTQVLFPDKYDRIHGLPNYYMPSHKPLPRIAKMTSRRAKTVNNSSTIINISSMTIQGSLTSPASSNQPDQKSFNSRAYEKPSPIQYRVSSDMNHNSENYNKLHDRQESIKKTSMTSYIVLPPIEKQEIKSEVQGLPKSNRHVLYSPPGRYVSSFTHLPSIEKTYEKYPPLLRHQTSANSGVIDRGQNDIRAFKDRTRSNVEGKTSGKHARDRELKINLIGNRLGNEKYNMSQPDRKSDWHYQSKRVSPKTDNRYITQNKSYQVPVKISGLKTDSGLNSPFNSDKNSQQSFRESRNSERSHLEITGESMLAYRKTRTPLYEESDEYDIADEQDGMSLNDSEPYSNEYYSAPVMRSIALDVITNQYQIQQRQSKSSGVTSGLSRPRSDYIINSVN
ncbi:Hypothetical predicted protein [Mytilus galloprovincialis]|uniref:DZIP3-like HEPN domain-containing protein n=1 Tax=Mytilus galloprovincialis TaxID=29158 RepID=A0A8B6BIB1_MYTGA|nr:Hypothetical predicted protein [Mytilus galloprovincialis]